MWKLNKMFADAEDNTTEASEPLWNQELVQAQLGCNVGPDPRENSNKPQPKLDWEQVLREARERAQQDEWTEQAIQKAAAELAQQIKDHVSKEIEAVEEWVSDLNDYHESVQARQQEILDQICEALGLRIVDVPEVEAHVRVERVNGKMEKR
jgi:hypothetical protein